MFGYEYANPELRWLWLALPVMIGWYIWRYRKQQAAVQLSSLNGLPAQPFGLMEWLRHGLFLLRLGVVALAVLALTRPQSDASWQDTTTEGIDIVLALDISSSMLARDFKPDRLEASKKLGVDFIHGRENDRIGLVVFSGESFTQCPLTTDHAVLKNLFLDVENGLIEDGTAIGSGLATSVSRLKDSDAISRVVILLTDGSNNRGSVSPVTAAEIAKTFGIRVYTIGVGTNGMAPYPVKDFFGRIRYQNQPVKIDEKTLKEIAGLTGGKYFRATDNNSLKDIYGEIDLLERSKIETLSFQRKTEEFGIFALLALLLLGAEFLLKNTLFLSLT